jgi:hypothetical protein
MEPWKTLEILETADPSDVLSKLPPEDPFWVGASYAIDPFVGKILYLPLEYDPRRYGEGISPQTFDKLAKSIIDEQLTGDNLSKAITALSHYCSEDEWLLWYKPILLGELTIPLALEVFNNFCPDDQRIPPPPLSKPRGMHSIADLPQKFFLQPLYPAERVFWFLDSAHAATEVRCYDSQIKRYRKPELEAAFIEFAKKQPMDIVLFGYMVNNVFLADDLLTREQFSKESGAFPLHRRLMGVAKLQLPAVQMSPLLTPERLDQFYKELDLILQQGYEGAIIRNLDGHYPFREQFDVLIKPTIKATVTCTGVVPDVGIRAESTRGKKKINSFIRLGLTNAVWKDISVSSPIGRRLDVLSCGQKDTELLLPVFKQWR